MSANNAYLETARGMPNLTVRSDALVEHIVFSGPRTTGVSVRYDGTNAPVVEHAEEIVLSMAGADAAAHSGAFGGWVNRPHSRGTVTLTSTDPFAQPAVAERMLSDSQDLTRLRAGIHQLVELA